MEDLGELTRKYPSFQSKLFDLESFITCVLDHIPENCATLLQIIRNPGLGVSDPLSSLKQIKTGPVHVVALQEEAKKRASEQYKSLDAYDV